MAKSINLNFCSYFLVLNILLFSIVVAQYYPTSPSTEYYVKSNVCKMPILNPYTPELEKIYKHVHYTTCAKHPALVTSEYDELRDAYVLRIQMHNVKCYYEEIRRAGEGRMADNKYWLKKAVYFGSPFVVPKAIEGVLVSCYDSHKTKLLAKDGFAFVQRRQRRTKAKHSHRRPSVLMLGIDTLSRFNLRRSMPKLTQYLQQNGWFELQGYNKVDDNTFPNLMAVLAGYTPETAKKYVCDYNEVGCLNKVNFIWKDFHKAGYATALAEDSTELSTFNSYLPGFLKQPVDYYARPLLAAFSGFLDKSQRFNRTYCLGNKLSTSYVFDYCRDFLARYSHQQPLFGLCWANEFTSSGYYGAAAFDEEIVRHFERFREKQLFEHSIVIFFSDHGARYGVLRNTSVGYYEERMPILFIWLPLWFRQKYPKLAAGLQHNRQRLTSNYDLYLTLWHILKLGHGHVGISTKNMLPECPTCQTLFKPVPFDRSCAHAGIREHYCTCHRYAQVDHAEVRHIMPMVIQRMNQYLVESRLDNICSKFTLSQLQEVQRKLVANPFADALTYRIKYKTMPNAAQFEATVVYNTHLHTLDLDVLTISRLNNYAADVTCLKRKDGSKYCICYKNIKSQIH